MLTSIHLKNFRALRDVKIEPLRRVNLIAGQNDTGKTTVLEALRILLYQPVPGQCGNLPNEFRAGYALETVTRYSGSGFFSIRTTARWARSGAPLTGSRYH